MVTHLLSFMFPFLFAVCAATFTKLLCRRGARVLRFHFVSTLPLTGAARSHHTWSTSHHSLLSSAT